LVGLLSTSSPSPATPPRYARWILSNKPRHADCSVVAAVLRAGESIPATGVAEGSAVGLRVPRVASDRGGDALRAAEEGTRARRDLFRNGNATLVEGNDAESELARAQLKLVNAHIDARIARVRLDHAVRTGCGSRDVVTPRADLAR